MNRSTRFLAKTIDCHSWWAQPTTITEPAEPRPGWGERRGSASLRGSAS